MAQAKVFNVGQLLDFEWKLGVAVESSNCKALNAPFVSILLRTLDDNGKVISHAFELSFSEFQVPYPSSSPSPSAPTSNLIYDLFLLWQEFSKNFRDISNLMETL
jgi:hypothetical protein